MRFKSPANDAMLCAAKTTGFDENGDAGSGGGNDGWRFDATPTGRGVALIWVIWKRLL
jgi:hypothetical protein